MDFSNVLECIPHNLILLKLKSYGLFPPAVDAPYIQLCSYLSCRKQIVSKLAKKYVLFYIFKGVPHDSILVPVMFNIFINGIFHFAKDSALYHYADRNTLAIPL